LEPIAVVDATLRNMTPTLSGTPGASSDGRGGHQQVTPRPSLDLQIAGLKDVPPATIEISPLGDRSVSEINRPWRSCAIGVALLLAAGGVARFLAGLVFVHRYRRQSVPIYDAQLLDTFHSLARELRIATTVELVEVPTLGVAATIGWRHPLVLLPAAWRNWSTEEHRAVLAHELAHVAQRHFPLWLVGQAAVAFHFYHPLVHWLGRRLRLEQEIAADQLAANVFGNRRRYTNILAGLALGSPQRTHGFDSLGLFMARPLLMNRIAVLRKSEESVRRPSRAARSAASSLLALVALVALGLRTTPQVAAADESANTSPAAKTGIETVNSTTALLQITGKPTDIQMRTHAALLKRFLIIEMALREPETVRLPILAAQSDPVGWVTTHLDVGFIPNSEIMYVRMKDAGDETAQLRKLVDAIVQAYVDDIAGTIGQRRSVVRDALSRSYRQLAQEIHNKLEAQNRLVEELGFSTLGKRDPETELLRRELAEAVKSRAWLERKLAEIQTEYLVLEQQLKDPSTSDDLDNQLADDPNMNMMNQELMELQYRVNVQTGKMKGGRSKEADRLQQQIVAKQQRIAQYKSQLKLQLQTAESGDEERNSKRYPIPKFHIPSDGPDPLQQARKEFQIRAGVLQQQIAALNKTIQEKTEKLTAKNQKSVELEIGAAELEQLQQIAADMALKLEMFDVEAVAPPRVRVIQWAM